MMAVISRKVTCCLTRDRPLGNLLINLCATTATSRDSLTLVARQRLRVLHAKRRYAQVVRRGRFAMSHAKSLNVALQELVASKGPETIGV